VNALTWLQSQVEGRFALGLLVPFLMASVSFVRSRSRSLAQPRGLRMPMLMRWALWNAAMRAAGVSKGKRQKALVDAARKDLGCSN
jgi:hypothetical protein